MTRLEEIVDLIKAESAGKTDREVGYAAAVMASRLFERVQNLESELKALKHLVLNQTEKNGD